MSAAEQGIDNTNSLNLSKAAQVIVLNRWSYRRTELGGICYLALAPGIARKWSLLLRRNAISILFRICIWLDYLKVNEVNSLLPENSRTPLASNLSTYTV